MTWWRRLFGDRPIVTRLVLAVAAAMSLVLVLAGAFVYWRVEFALNRQLNQDLDAYRAVVVASAISRRKHDEALRELLLQLVIADLATLVAASLVGYGVARAALRPVERYRRAAEHADAAPVLPVDPGRDDEITRLGHT